MPADLATVQEICARHGHALEALDPRDQEIANLRDRCAAAEHVNREQAAALRVLTRERAEWEDDRRTKGRREAAMMEAIPHRRFAGGTRLDEMVVQTCAWLREVRPELWRA